MKKIGFYYGCPPPPKKRNILTSTSLSLFSSGSSMTLVVVPLPKNFIRPPSISSHRVLENERERKKKFLGHSSFFVVLILSWADTHKKSNRLHKATRK